MKSTFTKLIALLVLAVMMFALAACNQSATPNEEHKHTYSDKWTYDATNHWKVATCTDGDECKTAVAEKAAHTLSGDKCSVCGWTKPADPKPEVHTHTYAETLTAGETTHWYAATCNANAECATAKKDEAAHEFVEGTCVCGKVDPNYVPPHTHTYAETLTAGETTHWYAATCNANAECATAKKDEAAHEFVEGTCVCGKVDPNYVPPHTHTYAETLTAGETTHWYAATCNANAECATAKKDEAAHDFTNGNCVCGKLAPAGSEWNPIAIPSFPASITLNFTAELVDAEEWIYYTFTAAETKTLRVILPENLDMLVPQGEGYVYVSGTYDVELVAGTTYVIPFASEVVGEYTVTADYYVPTVAADISGTYYAYGTNEGGAITYNGTVVIDAANATLVYTFIGRTGNTNVVEYTYTITDGVVTLSNANGPINPNMAIYFGLLELDEDGMPAVFWYNGYEYTLNDFMMVTISGNYSYDVDDSTTVIVSFISGYVYFVYGEDNKVIYSYKVENDGSVTLTDDEDNVVTDVEIILDENNIPVSVVVDGTQYTLEEYVEQEEVLTGIEGTYDGIAMMSQDSLQVVITSTTVTFNYSSLMQGDSTATYDYTIVDGAVVLTKDGETVTAPEAAITLGDDGKPVSAVYNMTSYDLTSASSGGGTGDDEGGADGTYDNPYEATVPGDIVCEYPGDGLINYTFTATTTGYLTLTFARNDNWEADYWDTWVKLISTAEDSRHDQESYKFEIVAGTEYIIAIGTWSEDGTAQTLTVTASVEEAALSVNGDPEKPVNISTNQPGSLDQPGSDDEGYVYFTYNSWMDGILTLTFTGSVDVKYGTDLEALTSVTAQTELVIDIADGDEVYVLIKGDSTVTFTAETAYKLGTEYNPIILENWDGDQTCSYTGSDVYYQITGGDENGYVTLTSAFEGVSLGAMASDVYSMSYSSTGSIRFYLEAGKTATFCIGVSNASASATIAFTLSFAAGEHELDGSAKYPFEPVTLTGNFTCNFGGGYSYVWYKVETTATGYLTVSSANENAQFVISPAASSYESGAKEGTGSVSYGAPAGVCYIGIKTVDESVAEIAYTVSFEEKELEPDGSSVLPYTAVAGENTATVSTYDGVWYKITVDSACTITLSSTFVSENCQSDPSNPWWAHDGDAVMVIASTPDTNADDAAHNYWTSPGADVSYEAAEAGTYYICISNYCFADDVQTVVFTVTVTPAA